MNSFKYIGLLIFFSTAINAQVNVIEVFNKTSNDPVFDGNMTPSEIAAELYFKKDWQKGDEFKIEVSVPIVKDKLVLISDTSGLPPMTNESGEMVDQSVITIPFAFDSNNQSFGDYLSSMDTVLLKIKPSDVNSSSICGDLPLESSIIHTWAGYQLCTQVKTTYQCMLGVNNTANWFITNQVIPLSAGCYIES